MTHYGEIEVIASDNFGYFTAASARKVGVLPCELARWMKMQRIENPSRGVYRLANYPPSASEAYVLAVMSVGPDAFVYGESVLSMLNLVPTDPTRLVVGAPRRVRRKVPATISVVMCPGTHVVNYDGVRAQHLADAIRSARGYVRHDRRASAVEEGLRQGYLSRGEHDALVKELKHETSA